MIEQYMEIKQSNSTPQQQGNERNIEETDIEEKTRRKYEEKSKDIQE